ncbi:hypothetical protein BN946_scf185006.g21 [Trametes cinnabarina]|uniref:C2H2-type domain-containing protein n=1 Tax=Pycnoporus cinnabarinus TaxID=5643 RepID=A0A060SXH4_PYCCI|nr:hypothetical protein BN946_scf185006.g21 [Trametes cinnabarina]
MSASIPLLPLSPTVCPYCHKQLATAQGLSAHVSNRAACRKADEVARSLERVQAAQLGPILTSLSVRPAGTSHVEVPIAEGNVLVEDDVGMVVDPDDLLNATQPDMLAADPNEVHTDWAQPESLPRRLRVEIEEVEDIEEGGLPHRPWIEEFPTSAGATYGCAETEFKRILREQRDKGVEPWAPFADMEEWELAEWLITSGLSQTAIEEYLKLNITRGRTKPSYMTNYTFMQKVDGLPTQSAGWKVEVMEAMGDKLGDDGKPKTERIELWSRDIVECVKELMGSATLCDSLAYAPTRQYVDEEGQERLYDNMWSGNWWWDVQTALPSGATVAPVILASDKTTLSRMSGNKSAWPVYLTLGNIDKRMRRKPSAHGTILLGYLPVAKLDCFSDKQRRSLEGYRLFHLCMRKLIAPLIAAGRDGVLMTCADGRIRRVYPILAAYIADHPEQCLVAACQENHCPKCTVTPDQRGEPVFSCLRDPERVTAVLKEAALGAKPAEFAEWGLRALEPFWADVPHANIFSALTPDLLHQLHKGVFKDHLVSWATKAMEGGSNEVDRRFKAMLKHSDLRHFKNGISLVSQWTGTEYKNMEKVFLGVVAGAADQRVVRAVRSILDFIYLAHMEAHTDGSLDALNQAWRDFHEYKVVFIELGIREHFNFPKGHSMEHYEVSIRSLGTADGYSTEYPECLHIDFAKLAYGASNKQSTYTHQMTRWLGRQEAVYRFAAYLEWAATQPRRPNLADPPNLHGAPTSHLTAIHVGQPENGPREHPTSGLAPSPTVITTSPSSSHTGQTPRPVALSSSVHSNALSESGHRNCSTTNSPNDAEDVWRDGYCIAKIPAYPSLTPAQLDREFRVSAAQFKTALSDYLRMLVGTNMSMLALISVPLHDLARIPAYKQAKVQLPILRQVSPTPLVNIIHASPSHLGPPPLRTHVPSKMSTVLARYPNVTASTVSGRPIPRRLFDVARPLAGLRVARVRLIFKLPSAYDARALGIMGPLVYVEWFTPFHILDNITGMYTVSPSTHQRQRHASVIPLSDVRRVVAGDVLDNATMKFFVNPYLRHHDFVLLRLLSHA